MDIILASASPRRRELLALLYPDYAVIPADIDESVPEGAPAEAVGELTARRKTAHVATQHPGSLVIGADTIVEIDGEVLGKPRDAAEAALMLRRLSGREHRVYTGVSLRLGARERSFTQCTRVWFYPLSEREIEDYVATGDPLDKAGSYGIQGPGCILVERIDGDFFNVMGLPVARLRRELGLLLDESR
ncbi:Maf family protein [Ligaoa zhengdingensis]|uniref:Maf family protein n=2 Tax=Ligaoa zhengdingensis TaxID=2763658 RepID=UPI0031BB8C86